MAWHLSMGTFPRQAYFLLENESIKKPFFGFSQFAPLSDEKKAHLPTSAIQENNFDLKNDVTVLPGLNAVSQNFKDVVEELEPNVHEFYPITLKRKNGIPYEQSYYIFNCCQRFEAMILHDLAERQWSYMQHSLLKGMPYMSRPEPPFSMSKQKVNGRHFWGGGCFYPKDLFCSDIAMEQLRARCNGGPGIGSWFDSPAINVFEIADTDELWVMEQHAPPLVEWVRQNPQMAKSIGEGS